MATNTKSQVLIKNEFHRLHEFFKELKSTYFKNNPEFKEISIGMSDDYQIALEEGSTIIRVGAAIFGEREIRKNPNVPI